MNLPKGFRAGAVAAGLKSSGALDLTIIENQGPTFTCAGVFTTNKVVAAPVTWSKQILRGGSIRAILLNSGGANACTGSQGFADTHASAEYVGKKLEISSSEVAICSTGLIGEFLPMEKILRGVDQIIPLLENDQMESAARAIMTTDSKPKIATESFNGVSFTGIAKGSGMLAPSLATMLSVIMTDAILASDLLPEIFTRVVNRSYNRIDSDGCTSTNDSVFLLASGASGVKISESELEDALMKVASSLALQLVEDAEGHSKVISIEVRNALSESEAVEVGRACARNNLLKCALFGGDPNWGRILAAVGTADGNFDGGNIDVELNGIMVARASAPGEDRNLVDLSGDKIKIVIDLHAGAATATILTNDLTHEYVHENSAYAS